MSTPDSTARTRPVLTRDRIVDAAVELVDEGGPAALTMRAVADRLDAGAMSLYRHVAGRDELLDLVLERLASEVQLSTVTGDWRVDLAEAARDIRSALLRRPHLTILLTSRGGIGSGGLGLLDHTLGILRSAGLRPEQAVLANHALGNYVAGAALWEAAGVGGVSGEERSARLTAAGAVLAALPAETYPGIAWAGTAIVAGSVEARFEYGLQALIAGIAATSGT